MCSVHAPFVKGLAESLLLSMEIIQSFIGHSRVDSGSSVARISTFLISLSDVCKQI